MSVTCDYLVIGAGAQGIAFTDALVLESRTTKVVIVDRHRRPGGMWNDTYVFAKLDQPNIFFGLSSTISLPGARPKGGRGVSKRASKSEVLTYFETCMDDLVNGRSVRFFPSYLAEVVEVGWFETQVRLTSTIIAGKTVDVIVRKKVVESGYGSVPTPPSSHRFPFEVDAAVKIVRPHDLGTVHRPMYVVIGAGKTGLDTVLWLLSCQVPAEKVRWVVPRDSWYLVAEENEQERIFGNIGVFLKCAATAKSVEDVYFKLEEAGIVCRIHEQHFPEISHCIHLPRGDLASLRAVPAIRLGHVQRVATDRLLLEHGSVAIPECALCIDCTGNGRRVQQVAPIFSASTIKLQRVAQVACGPSEMGATFCAAYLGLVEAMYPGRTETKNSLCTPAPFPDHYIDWIIYQARYADFDFRGYPRLGLFILGHTSSRYHRMGPGQKRELSSILQENGGAYAHLRELTQGAEFSRLRGKPDAPAHDVATSENDEAKGASCKNEGGATKEQLALLLAGQDQLRKELLAVVAENHALKESLMVQQMRRLA